jgi:deazaflavin-dependent oxidoreductase (nitroreductase family)
MSPTPTRHWFANHVFNPLVAGLTRLGVSVRGSRILAVRGRKTGAWRTTPVDLLTHEGARYLVAPSGVTQWVRNVRAGGDVELRRGGRREPVALVELTDDEKLPVLRAYLRRWKVLVRAFFQGVGPDAPDADLARIAPGYPAFRVSGPKPPSPGG